MATEILRPNAQGDECNITGEIGADCPDHYQNVDEVNTDEDTTVVRSEEYSYERDLYNIDNSGVGAGTINHITVYARCRGEETPSQESLKICIKSNSTVTEDVEQTVTDSYANYSKQWTTNPADSQAWEWADIDALQIGVCLRRVNSDYKTICTQVWVVVDYTPVAGAVAGGAGGAAELLLAGQI